MKKIFSFILTAILLSIIPFSAIKAQDKKNEQKIKIIVSDGSGTKVIIDTLIKDGSVNEPIVLKDGKVITIGKQGDESMVRSAGDKEHVFVTVTSDGRESGNTEKEITVISSDSMTRTEGENGKVYVFAGSDTREAPAHGQYRVITGSSGNDEKEKTIIYMNSDGNNRKVIEKSYDVSVSTDDKGDQVEKSTYMIAKDGIVISVEGGDDAKTKELVRNIEKLMGIDKKTIDKKETVKVETKKSVKK